VSERTYDLVVVDDHRFIRESIKRSIDWAGLGARIVGEAQNGEEAQEVIARLRPDIVITDIKMPGLGGLDLADKLGRLSSRSKIIVITGFQEFEFALRAIKLGVVDLVPKPIKNEELIAAVKKAIVAIDRDEEIPPRDAEGDPSRSYGYLVDSILSYIDQHYAESLTLDRVAEAFRITSSHASRVIGKATGIGFVQHVNRRRIAAAEKLLQDPSLRVKEIITACGFSNYAYFLKVFREVAGCAPQEYRSRLSRAGDDAEVKNTP